MRNFNEETATIFTNTMLYCPKCQQTFPDGAARFCPNDDARLLPQSAGEKTNNQIGGVFTNALNRRADETGEKFSSVPRFSQIEPTFSRRTQRRAVKNEFDFELELDELDAPDQEESFAETAQTQQTDEPIAKPQHSIVKPQDSIAELVPPPAADAEIISTDEQIFESDSNAKQTRPLDRHAPENFVGQTVQDRYRITRLVEENDGEIIYLAKDENLDGKTVVFKILPAAADDSFINKIFAEERAALTRLNHPNIAAAVESGELPSGDAYFVSELVQGETMKDYLEKGRQFDQLRAARIVRQAADALSKAHMNGILHRNLMPENIVSFTDEDGLERVKLTGFGAAQERLNDANLLYKSPEQIEGRIANIGSDNYALAVAAYQLLTDRLPFEASSAGDLLKTQREGLKIRPSEIRTDLSPTVDEIIEKALSFNSFDRYQKAQTFGDELFAEIFANASLSDETEIEPPVGEAKAEEKTEKVESPVVNKPVPIIEPKPMISEETLAAQVAEDDFNAADSGAVKATEDLPWEKRSPEPPSKPSASRSLLPILGIAALLAALIGVWYYFINRPTETPVNSANESVNQTIAPVETAPIVEPNANLAQPSPQQEIEAPPSARSITPPPDTLYFQNNKEELKNDLLKNFLGFSLYYPKDWQRNDAPKNFLDISKSAPNGLPVEQMIVTYYHSRGTFKEDETAIFPAQVKETNQSLKKILPNYEMLAEGKRTVNNGWQAYEIQFEGTGKANGKEITIWGKRLFIPTAIRGRKNGYVVTMLATSLSPDVKGIEDVGVKGELGSILETFEPNQNF